MYLSLLLTFPFPQNKYLLYSLSKIRFNPWFSFEIILSILWVLLPALFPRGISCRWKPPWTSVSFAADVKNKSLGILGDFFQVQWATCLSLQWYDSSGLSHHSERQIHEAAACAHGPSVGLILLWADGSPSPYSMEAVIKTSVMDNSKLSEAPSEAREGWWLHTSWLQEVGFDLSLHYFDLNQPFPILQKASKISKGRLRLVRMDLCKTKIDLILNSIMFFPPCNRFFFWNYSIVI